MKIPFITLFLYAPIFAFCQDYSHNIPPETVKHRNVVGLNLFSETILTDPGNNRHLAFKWAVEYKRYHIKKNNYTLFRRLEARVTHANIFIDDPKYSYATDSIIYGGRTSYIYVNSALKYGNEYQFGDKKIKPVFMIDFTAGHMYKDYFVYQHRKLVDSGWDIGVESDPFTGRSIYQDEYYASFFYVGVSPGIGLNAELSKRWMLQASSSLEAITGIGNRIDPHDKLGNTSFTGAWFTELIKPEITSTLMLEFRF